MNNKILLVFIVGSSLLTAQEQVNIDSILEAYAKEVFIFPDSTLFLGGITLKWRGSNGKFYSADSGVHISFSSNCRDISVQTEGGGLFFFTISRDETELRHLGVSYDTLLLPTEGWALSASHFLGINFADGITGEARHDIKVPHISDLPDTFYLWKIAYQENFSKILNDFVSRHPEHSFISRAKDLLADFELYYAVESLIQSNKFDSAKILCLHNLKLRHESKLIGAIMANLAVKWAKVPFDRGNKSKAIEILKDFIRLSTKLGDTGKALNIFLASILTYKKCMSLSNEPTEEIDFDEEIITEAMAEFLLNILSEKEVYLFKYNSYLNACNYKKVEEICQERLRKYPNDSLAYEHLINCQTNADSVIKLTKEAIKKKVPISDGTIASIGSICYAENRFKEAVYFFEKVGDVANKFGLYYFNCYLKALVKNGRKDEAKQRFLGVLKDKTRNDTLSHRDYHYIIESAIALNLANIVKQFYSMAQTKLKPVALLYLRTSMSRWFCDNKEKEMAFKVLNDALKDTIAPQIYQVMGDCYKYFANYDSAEICYKKAIEISNSNWDKLNIILALGDIYLQVGDKDKIIIMLNDILSEIKEPADYIDKIKKWCNNNNAADILDHLSQPNETVEEQTPEEPVKESDPKEIALKNNMYSFQLAVEDFSTRADGFYPASFDVRVSDFGNPENLTVLELLPTNYKNPYDSTFAPVVLSLIDPPDWSKIKLGQVVYVAINIKGKGATKYKIYGKGEKGPLTLILTSGF